MKENLATQDARVLALEEDLRVQKGMMATQTAALAAQLKEMADSLDALQDQEITNCGTISKPKMKKLRERWMR
ncbi:hypothetical protein PI124_g18171 [Phytophthora idaei]|nr:hypothetical protein PI125_g18882 [Phytophthora idaei]KAG3137078.1 hypothetical protein PI126_g17543 [Phytophthora idaei]KAG3236824.1 hypothetical protein PI124_g18171 [Phytophthora idaei]